MKLLFEENIICGHKLIRRELISTDLYESSLCDFLESKYQFKMGQFMAQTDLGPISIIWILKIFFFNYGVF